MAHALVCDAVEAWLAAHWTHDDVPIITPNTDGGVPDDGGPFLKVDYPWCRTTQETFGAPGNNVHREVGGFRVVINARRGTGAADARHWSKEIETIFRSMSITEHLRCFSPSSDGDDSENDGNYFVLAVAVPYQFNLFG